MDNWDIILECGFDDEFAARKNFYHDACVYVLAMSNGSTKIGMSQQFLSRIIQIEHDTGLEVVNACHSRYMPNQAARALEARLHNYFKEYLCWRREYFNITFDEGVQKLCEALCSSDALKNPASPKVSLFEEFKNFIGNKLRYVVDRNRWCIYEKPSSRSELPGWCSHKPEPYWYYSLMVGFQEYLESKGELTRKMKDSSYAERTMKDILERIKSTPEYRVCLSDFDRQPYLINCKNGVVDLRTGTLLPHNPALLLTLNTNVEYRGLNYHSEEVDIFLKYIMPDAETRKAVLRFLGYALTGYNTEHVAMHICPPSADDACDELRRLVMSTFDEYYFEGPMEWEYVRNRWKWVDFFTHKSTKDYVDFYRHHKFAHFTHERLILGRYLSKKVHPQAVDMLTDKFINSEDFLRCFSRRPCWKALVFEDDLEFCNKEDIRRFLQVKLSYDWKVCAGFHLTSADALSGFLSVLVQAAMDWFQASEGGTKKGLIESPQMKAYKKSYLQKHGVNLSKREFEKWLYDTN